MRKLTVSVLEGEVKRKKKKKKNTFRRFNSRSIYHLAHALLFEPFSISHLWKDEKRARCTRETERETEKKKKKRKKNKRGIRKSSNYDDEYRCR